MMQNPRIAVEPEQVIAILRQRHAQQLDALSFEVATLTAALDTAQREVVELRTKVMEMTGEGA